MKAGRGKRIAIGMAVVVSSMLVISAFAFRNRILEEWAISTFESAGEEGKWALAATLADEGPRARTVIEEWYIGILDSTETSDKVAAIEGLVKMQSARAIPVLMNLPENQGEEIEMAVIEASTAIGLEAAPVLFRAMETGSWTVANAAADALTEMGPAEVVGANSEDPRLRLDYANALVRKKRFEEALEEYLWCFDNGGHFSPYSLSSLGEKYPPALQVLKEKRDDMESMILVGKTSWLKNLFAGNPLISQVLDLIACNRVLGEEDRTLEIFDKLKDHRRSYLRQFFLVGALDLLLEKQRYEDVLEVGGNPPRIFQQLRLGFGLASLVMDDMPDNHPIVRMGGQYYEALLGAGEVEDARKMASDLIRTSDKRETYAILIRHATRAGHRESVSDLKEKAVKSLSETEFSALAEELNSD